MSTTSNAIASFCLNCVLWLLTLSLLILFAPVILIVLMLRSGESLYFRLRYGMKVVRSTDILFTYVKPENQLNISGVFQLDGEADIKSFRTLIRERMVEKLDDEGNLSYPQVKQYVFPGLVNYYWHPSPNFDINEHVYYMRREPAKSEAELQDMIAEHHAAKFPRDAYTPPWEFALIALETEEEGACMKTMVVFQLNHIIADGSALAYFLVNQLSDSTNDTGTMIKKFTNKQRTLLNIKALWNLPSLYIRMMLLSREKNALHAAEGKLTGVKKPTWSKPIDLSSIKNIKNSMGGTVNDVLVGCLAKSLRDYLSTKQDISHQTFTCVFAVDVRSSVADARYFKNQVTGVVVPLSIEAPCVTSAVTATKSVFDGIKKRAEPIAITMGWRFLSYVLPVAISKHFVFKQVEKTTACISNLMGPQYGVKIDGHFVDFISFWPPGTHTHTMSVSFCSYNEQIRVGVLSDTSVLQNPSQIVENFVNNVQELKRTLKL